MRRHAATNEARKPASLGGKPTLLCCQGRPRDLEQAAVEVTGECAFDAAARLPGRLPRRQKALVVGGGLGMVADPLQGDDVEGPVELAVTAAVQAVPSLHAARGLDRTRAGERGEGCLASHPARVAARDE